jgi:hypothetical protein
LKAPAKPKQNYMRSIGFYLLITLAAAFLIYGFTQPRSKGEQKPISELLNAIKNGETSEVIVDGDTITGKLKNGGEIVSIKEKGESFITYLQAADIKPHDIKFDTKDNSTAELI